MRLSLTFTILLLSSVYGWSYNSLDSLKNELKNHPDLDTQRVNLLNELGYQYWIVDPVESEKYGYEALRLAEILSYHSGIASASRSIGVANWVQGNYEDGLNFLMKALVGYQSLQDTLNIANVMMNTGLIYSEQGSDEEALSYYQEALRVFELLKEPKRQINTANHIGEIFQNQKQFDDALVYYNRALTLSDSLKYTYGQATANLNLGSLYKDKGDLDLALMYCDDALLLQIKNGDWHGKALSLYTTGIIYMLKNDYNKAEKNLIEGLENAVKVSSKKLRSDILFELKDVAKAQNNYAKAVTYSEQYVILKDSLLDAEKLRNIVKLENKLALAKQEQQMKLQDQQLELLQEKSKTQTLFQYGLISGILLIIIIAYLIYSRQRLKIQKNRQLLLKNSEIYKSQKALAEVELENSRLKEIELNQKIDSKNKELTSYTVNFIQKNELMLEIKSTITDLKKTKDPEVAKKLNILSRLVGNSMNIDRDWKDFKRYFEEIHTDFFKVLKDKFPNLTSNELKLCALLKLNMNLKEAASIMGISPESVKTARYRLRKKLNLNQNENLVDFIIKIDEELVNG